jgi:hypothetical protein
MKTNLFAILSLIIVLISCSEKENANSQESINTFDFKPLNLNKYEIPATIYLPDETFNIGASTEVEVIHEIGDFKWDIAIGPNFKFKIDDWGDDMQILEAEKDKLKMLDFYKITFIKNTENKIIYKRELKVDGSTKASKKVGTEHITYHIFEMKEINGIVYVLKNNDEGSSKKIVDLLDKSFETLTSNNQNS